MSNQILYPKKWVVTLFAVLVLLGVIIVYGIDSYGWSYFSEWFDLQNRLDPEGKSRRVAISLVALLTIMAIPGLVLGSYLLLLAVRILRTQYFPPRGFPIICKTAIIQGRLAVHEGYKFLGYSFFAIALPIVVIWSTLTIFPEIIEYIRSLYG